MDMQQSNISADSVFYGGGFRWTPRAFHRVSPYTQFLFGGRTVTREALDPAPHRKLLEQWDDGEGTLGHFPKRSEYSTENSHNGPRMALGSGLGAVRNLEYPHSWINDVAQFHPQEGLKISTEPVTRIGTW